MSRDATRTPFVLSESEVGTIAEIMNVSMSSAATAASSMLDKEVTITQPEVKMIPKRDFEITVLEPAVAVEINYVAGISGSNVLILRRRDVGAILAHLMPDRQPDDLSIDEMSESALCELMNQMMASSATVFSVFLGRPINISTPVIMPIDDWETYKKGRFGTEGGPVVSTSFNISINDIMESEFISVMDIDLAKEVIDVSMNVDPNQAAEEAAKLHPPVVDATPAPSVAVPPVTPAAAAVDAVVNPVSPPASSPISSGPATPDAPIVIKDFEYGDFGGGTTVQEAPANLDLVMNVPVVVTVELGRTKRKIKEILEFGQGTIVELDKQAGSQVDVIVNGQLIAHGDVVVVGDNFSIRITEILKSRDSLTML